MKRIALALASLWALNGGTAHPAEDGPSVLILLAPGFQWHEFWVPYGCLRAAGYRVDVAAPAAGPVPMNSKKPDAESDTVANQSLADVSADRYLGLFIPGGRSPMELEKHEAARAICARFLNGGKPVAAICHGPRLLMQSGLLKDRVATMLNEVPLELPTSWSRRDFGVFVDREIVVDRNLITGRHPPDLEWMCPAFLSALAAAGGPEVSGLACRVLVVAETIGKRDRFLFEKSLFYLGLDARVWPPDPAAKTGPSPALPPNASEFDCVLIWNAGAAIPSNPAVAALLDSVRRAGKPVLAGPGVAAEMPARSGVPVDRTLAGTGAPDVLGELVREARRRGLAAKPRLAPAPDVILDLADDVDARALHAVVAQLRFLGFSPATAGSKAGWRRDARSVPFVVERSFSELPREEAGSVALGHGVAIRSPGARVALGALRAAAEAAAAEPSSADASCDTAILVSNGFFEDTFFGLKGWCAANGRRPVVVAASEGAVTSINGCRIEARSAESAEKVLASNSVVFVVDALWPRSSLSAEDKPAWLEGEKAAYQAAVAWTWKRHGLGDRAVLFGGCVRDFIRAAPRDLVPQDAPRVFNYNLNGGFWGTGEDKLKPHKPLAAVTAERVLTVHGADGIGEAMRLLTSMSQPGAAGLPAGRAPATGEPR